MAEIASIAKKSWNAVDITFGVPPENYHEAGLLILDNTQAIQKLHWAPVWNTIEAVQKTIEWYKEFYKNNQVLSALQIADYLAKVKAL